MTLTKEVFIDKIEIFTESGNLQLREATVIKDNDVEISRSFHRKVTTALDDHSTEEKVVRDISAVVHTPEMKAKETARIAKEKLINSTEKTTVLGP